MNSKALLILAFLVLLSSVAFSQEECGDQVCDEDECCGGFRDVRFCFTRRPKGDGCLELYDCECEDGLTCTFDADVGAPICMESESETGEE